VSIRGIYDCAFGALSAEISRIMAHGPSLYAAPKAQ
jgi:hypothetical protein